MLLFIYFNFYLLAPEVLNFDTISTSTDMW